MAFRFIVPPLGVQRAITREKRRFEGEVKRRVDLPPSHRRWDEGYKPPTPDEIREAFEPFTGSEIARMLGNEDARAVRRWTAGERSISYASWRLFLIMTGRVKASD